MTASWKVCLHWNLHRCLSNMLHCTVAETSLCRGDFETVLCHCSMLCVCVDWGILPWYRTTFMMSHFGSPWLIPFRANLPPSTTLDQSPLLTQVLSDLSICLSSSSSHPESLAHPLPPARACPPFPSWLRENQLERVHILSACQRVRLVVMAVHHVD